MKNKIVYAALFASLVALTACSKQEQAPASEVDTSATTADVQITPEQQAQIDAIDKPVLDEKNTDVPASVANAPADAATPHEENAK